MSRSEGEGVETFVTMSAEGGRGVGNDSMHSCLGFWYSRRKFGGYWSGGGRWHVATLSNRPKLCTLFLWRFTFCAVKCFVFEQWQLLHTRNSFPCSLGVRKSVLKGARIFVTKCDKGGSKFYSKIMWRHLWTSPIQRVSGPRSQLSSRNRGYFRKEHNGRSVKLIFRLLLKSKLGMNGAVILRFLRAFMWCTGTVTLCACPGQIVFQLKSFCRGTPDFEEWSYSSLDVPSGIPAFVVGN